jgi:predicted ATPase
LESQGKRSGGVPSLSLPDIRRVPPSEDLVLYEAVRLFVDRAVAVTPGFTVTRENAPAVAQVCHQLDGIPLAIELAAARVKVLAVEQIATRLDDRFRLLTGGSRAVLPRQQTLRAAIDWSYNLLSEPERVLLRRLAVFAGGWTLEAAEAICAGGGVEADQVLDLLTSLVDKSLVVAETHRDEARYRQLETLRQYGWDRLIEAREMAKIRTRHRTWYLGLAERADARLRGPEDTMWLNRLEVEHDYLRAALEWSSTEEDDAETRVRLAAALSSLWTSYTHWGEGRKWLETALAGSRDRKSIARVKALCGEGALAWRHGDYERARARCDESLALAQELDDQEGVARALMWRGLLALRQKDFGAAGALFEESLELFRKLGDTWSMAMVVAQMGALAHHRGDYLKPRRYVKRASPWLGPWAPGGESPMRFVSRAMRCSCKATFGVRRDCTGRTCRCSGKPKTGGAPQIASRGWPSLPARRGTSRVQLASLGWPRLLVKRLASRCCPWTVENASGSGQRRAKDSGMLPLEPLGPRAGR